MDKYRLWVPSITLLLDLLIGDPPNQYHPVAWMGMVIHAARVRAPRRGRLRPLAYGAAVVIGGGMVAAWCGWVLERLLRALPSPIRWVAVATVLKTTVALRGLERAATEVQDALENADLAEARRLVAWHLVSRDTSALGGALVAAAAIESVAENTSDSIVGPLFYYVLAGLPGALAYRWVNTCDSMLGYRDEEREWLGKVSAKLDDLLNLLPARLTAILLALAALFAGGDTANAWRTWHRDAGTTASPNAGHPMSVAAGALGVELKKTGHYRLGAGQRPPAAGDIGRAVALMRGAMAVGAGLLLVCALLSGARRRKS